MKDLGNLKNPYVGPVSFQVEDRDLFFGRDRESKLLLSLAIAERVVLFYAESGAGKSSLINAHLIPNLRDKKHQVVLPVVRVGGELQPPETYETVYNVYAFNVLCTLAGGKVKPKDLTATTLASLYTDKLLDIDLNKPHWIIIDQFEEIVTTNVMHRDKRADFFDQMRDLLNVDKQLSLVLVMREDHLAEIDDYAPRLPGRLVARCRMERLKVAAAVDAVRLPAEKAGRSFPAEVAQMLVADLSQERVADREKPIAGDHVDTMQLQIVCHNLWERLNEAARRGAETSQITAEHIKQYATVDAALESYYNMAVDYVVRKYAEGVGKYAEVKEADVRRWFGETLITPSRIRAQVNRGFFTSGDLPNKAVDLLLATHIIRPVEARGGKWYEISHDRFIIPILQSNTKWAGAGESPLAAAAQIWVTAGNDESFLYRGARLRQAQEEHLPEFKKLRKVEQDFLTASIKAESRRSRKLYAMLGVTVLLFIGALGFALVADVQRRRYEEEKRRYEEENRRYEAEKRRLDAQQQVLTEVVGEARRVLIDQGEVASSEELQALLEHSAEQDATPTPTPETTPTPQETIIVTPNPVVGRVRWKRSPDGKVDYQDNWDAQNIVTVDVPQLRGVPGASGGRIQFYRGAAAQLKAAFAEVEARGLLGHITIWNGTFARKPVGRTRLSTHALGIAFDINYDYNRTGQIPPYEGEEGSVRELVPIFAKYGFAWSGENRIPDGSHFEVVRLVPAPG